MRSAGTEPLVIGWREWIGLPQLGIQGIAAKIDTGARTTALHAVDVERREHEDGTWWLAFTVPAEHGHGLLRVEAEMIEEREVRNTSGVPLARPVIRTMLSLGRRRWPIEVTLADRTEMEFGIILGRTAIRRRNILVAPGRSFLAKPPLGFAPPMPADDGEDAESGGPSVEAIDEDAGNGVQTDNPSLPATERPIP